MKNALYLTVFVFLNLFIDCAVQAQTIVWTNTSSGDWNTAGNWSPNTVPGLGNTAIINEPGVTVTLNGATSASSIVIGTNTGAAATLSMNSQTLSLFGPLTVNTSGSFTVDSGILSGSGGAVLNGSVGWTGGSLAGVMAVSATGTLNITGSTLDMPGLILTNNGTVLWASGTVQAGSGSVLINNGLWNMTSDQTMDAAYGGAGAVFNNYGIVRKSGGAGEIVGASYFQGVTFNQLGGEIDTQNGIGTNGTEIAFQGAGTFSGGYITTNQYGLTVFSTGSFTLDGTVTGTNTWEDAANMVGVNVINGALTWVGGNWNGASAVTVAPNATLLIVGGAENMNMDGTQVTNNGTVLWASGTVQAGNGSVLVNNGLWNMTSDQTMDAAYGGNGAIFNNYGIVRKSGGAGEIVGASYFQGVTFNQLGGEIDTQNGIGTNGTEIAFQGAGTFSGGYITTNQYGLTVFSTGSFTLDGTVTGTNTWEDAANMVGVNVINGALTWVGGNWNGASAVTVAPNATLLIVGGAENMNMDGTQVTNNGTVSWISGTIQSGNGSVLVNNGLWNMTSDQTMDAAYGGNGAIFNNYGIVRKSGGAGEMAGSSAFQNVIFNQLGGVIDAQNSINGTQIAFQGGGSFSGGYVTTNQFGLVILGSGGFNINGTVTGTNTWEDTGSLTGNNIINGGLTWVGGSWVNCAVTIATNSTLIINTTSGSHLMDAISVTNNGTVNWSQDTLYTGNGTYIYNNGIWNAQDDQILDQYYGGVGTTFNNYGTLRKSGGASTNQTLFSGIILNQISGQINVQTGNLTLQGTENLTGGSTASTGTINLASGTFTDNGTVTTANVLDVGATMSGNNVINGALTWQAGSWNNTTIMVSSSSTLTINTASGNHVFGGCSFTNFGTVNWSQDVLYSGNGTYIYNNGIWNAQDDQILDQYYGGVGTFFNNYGTLRKSGGVSTNQTTFSGIVLNQTAGSVDVQTGNLVLAGTENFTGGYDTNIGTTWLGSGSFTINGTFTSSNVVDNPGNMVGNNVIIGALTWQKGSWNGAAVMIATNSLLAINTASGNHTFGQCSFTNNGTVTWSQDELYTGNGTYIYNNGLWIAQDDQTLDQYYGGAGTFFNNSGIFRKTGGATAGTVFSGTTFSNTGTCDSQTGIINLGNNYDLTGGTLNFGINSLTNYGQISLGGAAVLAGTVSANLNNGYQPIGGNSFTNLFYGSFTGAFTNAVLPFLDAWTTNYTATDFYLHVLNARPTLNAVAAQTVDELTQLVVTDTATDPDQPPQTLTFSLVSGPSGMTINSSTGVITWTPAQTNSPSTNIVAVSVTDNGIPALAATNSFTVYVLEVNKAPTLPVIPNQTVDVLAMLTVTNTAYETNIHAFATNYTLTGARSGMAITTNGIFTWTPSQSEGPSTNAVTVNVTNTDSYDLVNPHLEATHTFQIIVYAPSLNAIANQGITPGQTVSLTAVGLDNDPTRTLTYSLGSAPANATINSSTGAFSWRAPISSADTINAVQVEATANSAPVDSVTQSFQIIVGSLGQVTLSAISKTATQFEAQINGPQGPDYILESAGSLKGETWTPVLTNTPSATPFDMTTTNVNPTNEYYRIRLGP